LFLVLKTSRFTIRNSLSIEHIPRLYVARGLLNPIFPLSSLGFIDRPCYLVWGVDERTKHAVPSIYCIISVSSLRVVARTWADDVEDKWRDKAERLGPNPDPSPPMPMLAPFLIFSLASFVSLLIHVPFLGALVRLRANYTPKGLQIGEEGGMAPPAGLGLPDYFAMLLRIKRIEVSVVPAVASVRSRGACSGGPWRRLTRLLRPRDGLVYGRGSVRFSSYRAVL